MPTYVYECQKCGHRFERFQAISDPPRKRCPECRGAVRRVVTSGGGLVFKGSGFYITDYRKKEYRDKERKEKAGSSGGDEKGKAESDTKSKPEKP